MGLHIVNNTTLAKMSLKYEQLFLRFDIFPNLLKKKVNFFFNWYYIHMTQKSNKIKGAGASLVVQWLRHLAPKAEDPGSILSGRTRLPHAATKIRCSQINK